MRSTNTPMFADDAPVFAEVIVPLHLPKNYTWNVPARFLSSIAIGKRVEVSIRNKKYTGIVKRLFTEKPVDFNPLPLLNVMDDDILLYPQQLAFWEWMAHYYMCCEGDIMQAAVPSNFKLSSESVLIWNDLMDDEDLTYLESEEYLVAEALGMHKELRLSEVQKILDATHVYPIVKKLIDKHICFIWEEIREKYKAKQETFVTLQPEYLPEEKQKTLFETLSKAPKQLELLLAYLQLLRTEGVVKQPALLKKSGATHAQLKALVDKGILQSERRVVDRFPSLTHIPPVHIELSEAQQVAYNSIEDAMQAFAVTLLHGVTGSGKTEIYIKILEAFLKTGKQVLYMLPEIALTAQIINRLRKHFGNSIVIYHSKFNPNERVDIWNKVKTGEAKIILGARSSLLLPFQDLGLIIVDEEHDTSYKQQEPTPRYQARDAAIFYASIFHAKVLLGSATPSLETYYNCRQGKYGLVTLSERYGQVQLPEITLVDLKLYPKEADEPVIITAPLKEKIEETITAKQQVILFQNRRGYSPYIQCAACGWIPECKNCKVSLTWHKHKNKLSCHYCGTEYPVVNICPACGSHHFIQKNFGTEQIEEVIADMFAHAHTARMDLDSVRGKHDHEALINLFETGKVDILVGTQMVVKGLDFEHVQLVGILDADSILNFADFRVNERAFQLMEQVSGRAGRRDLKGEVMIQVSNTEHPVLQFVKAHDYQKLYDSEIPQRNEFGYPPFTRMIRMMIKHRDHHTAEAAAHLLVERMTSYRNYITGPAEPYINRIRNQYIWEIMIKLPKDIQLIQKCKAQLLEISGRLQSEKAFRSVVFLPDVDPI